MLPPGSPAFNGDTALRDHIFNTGVIPQESGGRPGLTGPVTPYGRALGVAQTMPDTARQMAAQLGVPYDESMLHGTSPEASAYQRRLGQAYWNQAWQASRGNPREALMYYYGGPNPRMHGPHTRAYADHVSRRVGL